MTEMVSVPAPRGMHKPLEMIGTRLLKFYRDRLALVEPIHHTDNERQVLVAALELLQAALQVPSEKTLNAAPQAGRVCEPRFRQESRVAGPAVAAPVIPSDKTVPIEKARERIAGIEEYLARQKTTSVKEEQAHLVEGSDASLYWHFGYMMALKDIFRLSGKQQDQDGKIFQ